MCRTHGGASTGPKTGVGKAKCAEIKTVHGREGRKTREIRARKLADLRKMKILMQTLGMFG